MRRREFIAGLGSAAAWPVAARTQQRRTPVVGILGITTAASYRMAAFMQGLKEVGFIEGQNVGIEQRWANNQYDRLPEMAADLVRSRVSLIAAIGNNLAARAAKAATSTIPIVFSMGHQVIHRGQIPIDRVAAAGWPGNRARRFGPVPGPGASLPTNRG